MKTSTSLMPHQAAAVEKVGRLRVGALFMEMGTGKSRTAIELAVKRQERISRVVWFCPVGLRETVRQEILKHTRCGAEDIYAFDDHTRQATLPREATWYVVGIESMSASRRVILAVNSLIDSRAMVIVDESSYIKGPRAKRTDWITRVAERARYRLLLTGTPISNGVQDLFAQMRFLSPQILGYRSFYSFANNHLEYSKNYPGMIVRTHNTGWLAARIAPYTYQVTKAECLTLPGKLYETRHCLMTGDQAGLYEQAKDDLLMSLPLDHALSSYTIFRLFTALQEIVCGFWNRYPEPGARRSEPRVPEMLTCSHNRLETLRGIIQDVPAGEKVIVWAKYRRVIDEICAGISDLGEPVPFHGGLRPRERTAAIERFRGAGRFFVATPGCGGHGLTLNEAAHVVFYTNDFKYSERLQAEDRCHRIGQTRPVTYVDIVCSSSIDQRIQNALANKQGVVESFRREVNRTRDAKTIRAAIKAL